ncbi:MAG: ASCH domain-containing protein [Candidatus Heimdallarchaeota archaeon]
MKRLKFSEPLPDLVLSGEKDSTWRINDDKDITIDDVLSLCRDDGTEFARAKVKWIKLTRFRYLTEEDKQGHESFSTDEEMYRTYSGYYDTNVTPDTPLKIIKYKLM